MAEKTFDKANASTEDAPVSLYLDSPYQISKVIGEFYSNYYYMRHQLPVVKAAFKMSTVRAKSTGAGQWRGTPATVWRNITPSFIYRSLKHMPLTVENGGIATRFYLRRDIAHGLLLCATRGSRWSLYTASGVETTILELEQN